MSSEKPDQIQASVAAALSRLRGDLGPSGATAPKIDEPQMGGREATERGRPANDVRGDPFFRSIQSPPPGTGMAGPGRAPIPMTPFPRMQAPQEPAPSDAPMADEPAPTPEPASAIEIPAMPQRSPAPDLVPMPESTAMSSEPSQPSSPSPAASQPAAAPAATPQPQAAPAGNSPLSRVMRGNAAGGATDPAQRDLLAGLAPPPISEPLTGDAESSVMRRRRRNRRLLAAAAIIIVVAIGAWLWRGSEPSTEIPVVAAETTPEKVKPAEEEGLQVANQNIQVLDPTQSQAETVMPEPEQPVTPPAATAEQAPGAGQAPTVVENAAPDSSTATTEQAPAVDAPPAPETPLTAAPLPEPENATADATPPAPAVPAPQPAQTAEAPSTNEPAQAAAEPTSAPEPAPAATQPEPAQATQSEPTVTQEAAVTPSAPAGNIRVQLAAGKSEASVQKEWAALQKAHPDLLGSLSLTIEKVDKGAAGVFYRLQAGPLADKAAAKKLCASLKQAHQDCIVVR